MTDIEEPSYKSVILSKAKNPANFYWLANDILRHKKTVHFFFFISTKKEKAEPKKKNTNDQMARVIRGFAPEPLIKIRHTKQYLKLTCNPSS